MPHYREYSAEIQTDVQYIRSTTIRLFKSTKYRTLFFLSFFFAVADAIALRYYVFYSVVKHGHIGLFCSGNLVARLG